MLGGWPTAGQCALCRVELAPLDGFVCEACWTDHQPAITNPVADDVISVSEEVTYGWLGASRATGDYLVSLWGGTATRISAETRRAALQGSGPAAALLTTLIIDSPFAIEKHGAEISIWRSFNLWWLTERRLEPESQRDAIKLHAGYRASHARMAQGAQLEAQQRKEEDEMIARAEAIEAERRRNSKLAHARTVLAGNEGSAGRRQAIPREVRLAVFTRDEGRCVECDSNFDIQYDHIIPVALGGASTVDNLQILCADCNRKKGATL